VARFRRRAARTGLFDESLPEGDGPPVETIHEAARREARRGGEPAVLATAVTGVDGGGVLVPKTRDGLVEVRVGGPGVVAYTLFGAWGANESDELPEVTLARSRALSGRVVDAAGAAGGDAGVVLIPPVAGANGPCPRDEDASNGTFRSTGPGDGERDVVEARHAPARARAERDAVRLWPWRRMGGSLPSKKPAAGSL
jgi:hypothetical protein